jgi:hypothetical protein
MFAFRFVKRSSLPTANIAEEPKPEDVKTEVLKAADVTVKAEAPKDVTTKAEEPKDVTVKVEAQKDVTVKVEAPKDEGWRLWRALPDLKDVSDDELKQHWEEMVKSKPKPKPLVGFLSAQQEVKTIVHTTEVYLSEKAFDFLDNHYHSTTKGMFRASNGYTLCGGSKWSFEWRLEALFMDSRFRGNRVNLNLASDAKNQTTETINKLKEALTELSAAITKGVPQSHEVDLSNMESL